MATYIDVYKDLLGASQTVLMGYLGKRAAYSVDSHEPESLFYDAVITDLKSDIARYKAEIKVREELKERCESKR